MDESIKKIINNSTFIAILARLLPGDIAARLSNVALAYRDILAGLGVKLAPDHLEAFKKAGCDQAKLLVKWCRGEGKPDEKLMAEWTDDILDAIEELAGGNLP